MILQENVVKLPLRQIVCLCMINYVLNCIQRIWMLEIFPIKAKTLVVVIELVSQQLDQYKNNSAICKSIEILLGQI